MGQSSDISQLRLKSALYVAAGNRLDNCGGCTYTDLHQYGNHWCRLHSAPTTKGSICAAWEPPKRKVSQ